MYNRLTLFMKAIIQEARKRRRPGGVCCIMDHLISELHAKQTRCSIFTKSDERNS